MITLLHNSLTSTASTVKAYVRVPVAILRQDLTGAELRLWLYLAWRQGKHSRSWPKPATIAEELGISICTLWRAVKGLQDKGLLEHKYRGNCTHYWIVKLPEATNAVDNDNGQGLCQKRNGTVSKVTQQCVKNETRLEAQMQTPTGFAGTRTYNKNNEREQYQRLRREIGEGEQGNNQKTDFQLGEEKAQTSETPKATASEKISAAEPQEEVVPMPPEVAAVIARLRGETGALVRDVRCSRSVGAAASSGAVAAREVEHLRAEVEALESALKADEEELALVRAELDALGPEEIKAGREDYLLTELKRLEAELAFHRRSLEEKRRRLAELEAYVFAGEASSSCGTTTR